MKKPVSVQTTVLLTGMVAAGAAQAEHDRAVYAKVVRSEPIVRYVDVSTPRQECWQEAVHHRAERDYTTGRTVLGGLIGAAVGNQIGKRGRHRDAATVVGGVAGAAIGANSAKRDRYDEHYVTHERRCRTVYEYHREERIDGYEVTYRYGAETYTTRMPYDPGKQIPVHVSVTPADY